MPTTHQRSVYHQRKVHSILKAENSRTFKDLNSQFPSTKIIHKSHYILDEELQNLDCNVSLRCTILYLLIHLINCRCRTTHSIGSKILFFKKHVK